MKTIVSRNWVETKIDTLKHTKNNESELNYWKKVLRKMKRKQLQIIEL